MIRHGTANGYKADGCRCRLCTDAAVKADAKRRLATARGETWTAASEVRASIEEVVRLGVTPSALRSAAGTSVAVAKRAISGRGRIRADIAERVSQVTVDNLPDSVWVDMAPARDAVEVLLGRGWSKNRVAQDVFGWTKWPGDRWLTQDRASLGKVRAAIAAVGCVKCGRERWAGGRLCYGCTVPGARLSRQRVQQHARRRQEAA